MTQLNVKNFHIEWNNNLKEKERYSWQPIELYSSYKTIKYEIEFTNGEIIKGERIIDKKFP